MIHVCNTKVLKMDKQINDHNFWGHYAVAEQIDASTFVFVTVFVANR